jgi:hypothetical protein
MGISISLLFSEGPTTYSYTGGPNDPGSKMRQPPGSNPYPNPSPNPNLTPRDRGLYFADADEFHASEILAIVSSALNGLVAIAL